jgi:hypothetical protein
MDFINENLTDSEKVEFSKVNWSLYSGALIGELDLTKCIEVDDTESVWAMGDYCFVRENPILYDKPIPCRGALGFFKPEVPDDFKTKE